MASIGEIVVAKAAANGLPSPLPAVRVVDLLSNGGVAVVVGVRGDNVTDAMRRHPQILCWDTTDAKTHNKSLPANTRALMITRFISHAMERRLRDEAKRRGIFAMPGLITTGDVRDQLQLVVDRPSPSVVTPPAPMVVVHKPEPPKPEPKPDPPITVAPVEKESPVKAPTLRPVKRGELQKFVIEHADPRVVAVAAIDESNRLWRLIRSQGIDTTRDSVRQAVWKYVEVRPSRTGSQTPVAGAGNGHHVTPALPTPEPEVERRSVPRRDASAAGGDALLTSLDEAMKYVGEVKAAMGLLDEVLPLFRKEIERFRDQQRRARELFKLD